MTNKKVTAGFSLMVFLLIFFCSMVPEKSGETWWYVHGEPYYWHYQHDVYAFRTIDSKRWSEPLDTNCVDYLFYRSAHRDKLNIIYFKSTCSDTDKDAVKAMIRSSYWFEAEFPAITLYPDLPYDAAKWFVMDDLLLVNFKPGSINKKKFKAFKEDYGLHQINFPDSIFPDGIFTYIFEFDVNDVKPGSAIDLAKNIYLQDSQMVVNVQPNLINAYEKISEQNNQLTGDNGPSLAAEDLEYYLVHRDNKSVKLFVKFKNEAPLTIIRVYDLFGREMGSFKEKSQNIEREISISDYVGGIYFASIENGKGEVLGVQKFVKL